VSVSLALPPTPYPLPPRLIIEKRLRPGGGGIRARCLHRLVRLAASDSGKALDASPHTRGGADDWAEIKLREFPAVAIATRALPASATRSAAAHAQTEPRTGSTRSRPTEHLEP
jgi:hypothetical protein